MSSQSFKFTRYSTEYSIKHERGGRWKFSRYTNGRGRRADVYFADNCRNIRDAMLDYFHGIDDSEASLIVASTTAE